MSNCPCGYIEAFLESQGLQKCFKDFEMSGRTGKSKGENIKALCERNGLCAGAADANLAPSVVYVGDTLGDETAANFAGIPFIHAAYGFGTANNPDAVINSFDELLNVLEKI